MANQEDTEQEYAETEITRISASEYNKRFADRPKKKRRLSREDKLQVETKRFLDRHLTPDTIAFHCPNGEKRSKSVAEKLRKMGVVAGVADWVLCDKGRFLAVELKPPKGPNGEAKGYPSQRQKDWRDDVKQAGGEYAVCYTLEDFEAQLRYWGVALVGLS